MCCAHEIITVCVSLFFQQSQEIRKYSVNMSSNPESNKEFNERKYPCDIELIKIIQNIVLPFNMDPELFCAFKGSVEIASIATVVCFPVDIAPNILLGIVKSRITGPYSILISELRSTHDILQKLRQMCSDKIASKS